MATHPSVATRRASSAISEDGHLIKSIYTVLLGLIVLLVGCVTINIYFPEAAAQQAADRIIDEVRGAQGADEAASVPPRLMPVPTTPLGLRLLDLLIPAAAAQQADFDAQSPASRALEQSLKNRFPQIKPFLDGGAVGLTSAGLLEIRDRNAVPLAQRNAVRQLISEQNTDWEALYREIARINGHPEWVDQIRSVFAERWIAKADRGWYYRDAGGTWKQR
jgi:uncharacterized protein YdbL (DUF1318 family)